MPFSLIFLNQLLFVLIGGTFLTTIGMIPRFLRESRLLGLILMAFILQVGEIAAGVFHNLWLIPAALLFPFIALIVGRYSTWAPWARINAACLVETALVYLLYYACLVFQSSSVPGYYVGGLLWSVQAIALFVSLAVAFDLFNAMGRRHFPERDRMLATQEPEHWPAVCFQVAAYNEPPELLARTIKQLMQQDYPGHWMIQVIDNNTPHRKTWTPIRDLCLELGERVQFIHLDNWPGFKSGALNEGTRRLPDWVEVVAIVDADYLVAPDFLRATSRHFSDPEVAFVQTPQHYRKWQGSPYFEGLNYMYEYFYRTYMISRRETNSVVCSGTMVLVRRHALDEIGLWDEVSITEDADLSLRLLSSGWRGIYDHRSYGAGLMPFNFGALKKQRFRWVFGMLQLFKRHWRILLGLRSKEGYGLKLKQRLGFYGLGFQYLVEVPPFILAVLLVVNVFSLNLGWKMGFPPFQAAMMTPLLLTFMSFIRMFWSLKESTRCTFSQATGACIFFFSLSWITAHACLSALSHKRGVFLRTPKTRAGQKWQQALCTATLETLLALFCLGMALWAGLHYSTAILPIVLLGLQALICGSSALCALAAEGIWLLPAWLFGTGRRGNMVKLHNGKVVNTEQLGALPALSPLPRYRYNSAVQVRANGVEMDKVHIQLARKKERMIFRQQRILHTRKLSPAIREVEY